MPGHAGGHFSDDAPTNADPHADFSHEPAPPEPRRLLPPFEMLIRGLGLGALALASGAGVRESLRHGPWFAPLALPLAAVAFLSAWAAAIHLTGGEKFDDHPWI